MPVSQKILNCEAVLFDNEGTLIDAREATRHCWSTFASWYRLPTEEILELVPGRPARDVIGHYADQLPVPVEEALERYKNFANESDVGIHPIPGAIDVLTVLPSDRWAVVTSGTRDFALRRISAAGLPVPPQLIAADDVTDGKPDPAPYRAASERVGFHPSHCLAVDDAPAGISSAARAGCQTLGILTTHSREQLAGADSYIRDFNQIEVRLRGHGLRLAFRA